MPRSASPAPCKGPARICSPESCRLVTLPSHSQFPAHRGVPPSGSSGEVAPYPPYAFFPHVKILECRRERLYDQFVTRTEMFVEAPNRHARFLHHIGDADTLKSVLAKPLGGPPLTIRACVVCLSLLEYPISIPQLYYKRNLHFGYLNRLSDSILPLVSAIPSSASGDAPVAIHNRGLGAICGTFCFRAEVLFLERHCRISFFRNFWSMIIIQIPDQRREQEWLAVELRRPKMSESTLQRNKTFVLEAFETLFNKKDFAAAEKFWSSNYIQHSAHIPPGRDGLFALIKGVPPEMRYENRLIMAEG